MFRRFRLETGLGFMLVLTVAALLGEHWILKTSTTITPSSGYQAVVYDDRSAGGKSVGELLDKSQTWAWQCSLREGHPFPFCGFELIFDPMRQNGLDLTSVNRIRLWLEYEGNSPYVRIFLRNYNPAYSDPGQYDSTKYNQVEIDSSAVGGVLDLSIADFFVANWWITMNSIPPPLSHPEFDNIVVLEINTATNTMIGDHRFRLRRIELIGQRITTLLWYQLLFGIWLAAAFIFFLARMLRLKRELNQRRRREKELIAVNKLLDSRGRELEKLARTDPLTGAFNREGVKQALETGLSDRRQADVPMTLVLLDIDHFKSINDTYGHLAGDKILVQLSELVQENIRQQDVFARWGGEEFMLLCHNTSLTEGEQLAEKLRKIAAGHEFPEGIRITVSMGIAALNHSSTIEDLFSRADKALYRAKKDGRNRIVTSR